MIIGKPFKGATKQKITQGWSEKHQAIDLSVKYGEWLVAPFNCVIERIRESVEFEKDTNKELELGFGLLMRSIENPTITCTYWHTMGFFPVNEGMNVLKGEPVAQAGNSGYVLSNGQYVPLSDRTKFPFYGTHLHWSMSEDWTNKIDWQTEPHFNTFMAIYLTFQKIKNFLKERSVI